MNSGKKFVYQNSFQLIQNSKVFFQEVGNTGLIFPFFSGFFAAFLGAAFLVAFFLVAIFLGFRI